MALELQGPEEERGWVEGALQSTIRVLRVGARPGGQNQNGGPPAWPPPYAHTNGSTFIHGQPPTDDHPPSDYPRHATTRGSLIVAHPWSSRFERPPAQANAPWGNSSEVTPIQKQSTSLSAGAASGHARAADPPSPPKGGIQCRPTGTPPLAGRCLAGVRSAPARQAHINSPPAMPYTPCSPGAMESTLRCTVHCCSSRRPSAPYAQHLADRRTHHHFL